MTALALTITTAGRAAAVNAANTGLSPIVISHIALGSGSYTPTAAQTALAAEFKRSASFGADVVADNTLHVTITDTSADTYTLGEIGLYTDTGVLFAVYSQTTPILEKGAEQLVLLSADILLTSVPPGSVTIGDTDFMLPPATTTRQGIIEIATDAEVDAGTDATRAVTPAGVKRRIETRAPASRTVTAGNGLTGGGSLTADRTLALGTPGTLTTATTNSVSAASHTHAVTFPVTSVAGKTGAVTLGVGDVAGAAASARTLTAGNGLTGGGDLTADRTLTLGTPGTLTTATTNSVSAASHTHAVTFPVTSVAGKTGDVTLGVGDVAGAAASARTLTAGNGLTGGGNLTADRTLTLGTPGTLTTATTNSVSTASHTHAVTFPVTSVAGKTGAVTLGVGDVAGAAASARTLTAGNGLTGGGDLSADRALALGTPGTLNGSTTNAVSATSHTHAISAATEALRGVVELATSAETQAGIDAVRAVTPAALASFAKSLTANGHCKLPGGLIIQWGNAEGQTIYDITFPIAFPNALLSIAAITKGSSAFGYTVETTNNDLSSSRFTTYRVDTGAQAQRAIFWIAIGY